MLLLSTLNMHNRDESSSESDAKENNVATTNVKEVITDTELVVAVSSEVAAITTGDSEVTADSVVGQDASPNKNGEAEVTTDKVLEKGRSVSISSDAKDASKDVEGGDIDTGNDVDESGDEESGNDNGGKRKTGNKKDGKKKKGFSKKNRNVRGKLITLKNKLENLQEINGGNANFLLLIEDNFSDQHDKGRKTGTNRKIIATAGGPLREAFKKNILKYDPENMVVLKSGKNLQHDYSFFEEYISERVQSTAAAETSSPMLASSSSGMPNTSPSVSPLLEELLAATRGRRCGRKSKRRRQYSSESSDESSDDSSDERNKKRKKKQKRKKIQRKESSDESSEDSSDERTKKKNKKQKRKKIQRKESEDDLVSSGPKKKIVRKAIDISSDVSGVERNESVDDSESEKDDDPTYGTTQKANAKAKKKVPSRHPKDRKLKNDILKIPAKKVLTPGSFVSQEKAKAGNGQPKPTARNAPKLKPKKSNLPTTQNVEVEAVMVTEDRSEHTARNNNPDVINKTLTGKQKVTEWIESLPNPGPSNSEHDPSNPEPSSSTKPDPKPAKQNPKPANRNPNLVKQKPNPAVQNQKQDSKTDSKQPRPAKPNPKLL